MFGEIVAMLIRDEGSKEGGRLGMFSEVGSLVGGDGCDFGRYGMEDTPGIRF